MFVPPTLFKNTSPSFDLRQNLAFDDGNVQEEQIYKLIQNLNSNKCPDTISCLASVLTHLVYFKINA